LDDTLSLALYLHKSSPLAFSAFALFVLFPMLLLRPLPDGFYGSFTAAALTRRCSLLKEGKIATMISEAHESQLGRVMKQTKAVSIPTSTTTFSKKARATILAGARAVGRACKLAFSYGLETDPEIAAKLLAKLTLKATHANIQAHILKVKPPVNRIPRKTLTDASAGMPKKSAAHRDGWTWELFRYAAHTPSTASLLRKFAERFSNGAMPQDMWAYLASAL
jgi:hypothetical protein